MQKLKFRWSLTYIIFPIPVSLASFLILWVHVSQWTCEHWSLVGLGMGTLYVRTLPWGSVNIPGSWTQNINSSPSISHTPLKRAMPPQMRTTSLKDFFEYQDTRPKREVHPLKVPPIFKSLESKASPMLYGVIYKSSEHLIPMHSKSIYWVPMIGQVLCWEYKVRERGPNP